MVRQKSHEIIERLSEENMWQMLNQALIDTTLGMDIRKSSYWMGELKRIEKEISADNPNINESAFKYWTRVSLVRKMIRSEKGFYYFLKWVFDHRYIDELQRVKERFFRNGRDELPEKYLCAERYYQGQFRWDDNADINMVLIPRGLGKTNNDYCGRAVWSFICHPTYKWLLVHSTEEKVKGNLEVIKNIIHHPNLAITFPEYFVNDSQAYRERGTRITRSKINIKKWKKISFSDITRGFDYKTELRKEATFTISTPKTDPAGLHFNGAFVDDLVTKETSATDQVAANIIRFFESLSGLEEYTDDDFGFPIWYTDTMWYSPSLNEHLLESSDLKVRAFVLPLTWDDQPNVPRAEHKYKASRFVTPKFIERKRGQLGMWFDSQMYMEAVDRDAQLELVASDRFLFAYHDEHDAPEAIERIPKTKEELLNSSYVVTSKDPSYSEDKDETDTAVSKDTTITAAYDGVIHIIDEYQQFGGNDMQIYAPYIDQIQRYKSDLAVQDATGPQKFVYDVFLRQISRDAMHQCVVRPCMAKRSSKADRAVESLKQLFDSGNIKIHWRLHKIINEVKRKTKGFDFIDTLVQICDQDINKLDVLMHMKIRKQRRRDKEAMQRCVDERNAPSRQRESNTVFQTSGY